MTTDTENTSKIKRPRNCPECKSARLLEHDDEKCSICLDCGFVISAETAKCISERKTDEDQRESIRLASCSTKTGPSIHSKESNRENMVNVLEQWRQVKIGDATEKNMALALQYATKIGVDLSLPKIALEKASLAYKKTIEKNLVKGRSMKALAAVAVYIGCKQCKIAITTKDIAHASKISLRKIIRSYRSITKRLDFSIQPTTASWHAAELSLRLQVSRQTMELVEKTLKILEHSKPLIGKDPTGIACATIYISSLLTGERITQREIAEVARITEATIRARCRELRRSLLFSFHL